MTRFAPFFFLLSFAVSTAPAGADDISRYSGKFIGCAVSSGEWVPVATTFTVSGDRLSGSYVFIEKGEWYPGSLAFEARDGEAEFRFTWNDIYGTGGVSFDFASDANRFDGFWTSEEGNSFPWNGVRQGSGMPQPDCSAPVA